MSCRLSRWTPYPSQPVLPVTCADCGVGSLTVYYTSREEQVSLCPTCFQSRVRIGLARATELDEA